MTGRVSSMLDEPEGQEPIPNTYWVETGRLLAGEYPGAFDERRARRRLRWLLEQGVDYCLDLTEAGEYGLPGYAPWLVEEATHAGRQMTHRRIPISDYSAPPPGSMARILDTLDEALQSGHVVYVHCYGGKGRTGTVVGCYLVRGGMDGRAALQRLAGLRQGSPETEEQRRYVLSWKEG